MVTVTVENVTNVATELESEDEDRVELFIEFARGLVDEGQFATEAKARLAISLLAAHYLTVSPAGGSDTGVTSESLGDLSVSYGSGTSAGDYESTGYGQMYLALAGASRAGPYIV